VPTYSDHNDVNSYVNGNINVDTEYRERVVHRAATSWTRFHVLCPLLLHPHDQYSMHLNSI
jgi:hypothetical protein